MKFLLLIAHGSRRKDSNEEVARLAARVGTAAGGEYAGVRYAYLELATPSIPEAIEDCLTAGAAEVIIVPYFLAAGRHVQEDIPAIIADKQSEHPEAAIRLTAHLGTASALPALLLNLARQ